jgi:hypothetical protein
VKEELLSISASTQRSEYISTQKLLLTPRAIEDLCFAPLQMQRPRSPHGVKAIRPTEHSYPIFYDIRDDDTSIASTPFSSNSTGSSAEILTSLEHNWLPVYVKTAHSVSAELAAFPMVPQNFPDCSFQNIAAAEVTTNRIFFKRFDGDVLNQIPLHYRHGVSPIHANLKD